MNIKSYIFNFVKVLTGLFTFWLSDNEEQWAWCPVKADNFRDRY